MVLKRTYSSWVLKSLAPMETLIKSDFLELTKVIMRILGGIDTLNQSFPMGDK